MRYVQPPHFQIFSIHDNVVESEKYREPILDHWVVSGCMIRVLEATIGALEHSRDDTSKHGNRKQADLLILAHFAEVGDAHREVGKGAMAHDRREMLFVEACYDLEG